MDLERLKYTLNMHARDTDVDHKRSWEILNHPFLDFYRVSYFNHDLYRNIDT